MHFVPKSDYIDLFKTVTWAVWFGNSEMLVTRPLNIKAGDGKMAKTSRSGK